MEVKKMIEILKKLPQEQEIGDSYANWHPYPDEKPDEGDYLAIINGEYYGVSSYFPGNDEYDEEWIDEGLTVNVTDWAELPYYLRRDKEICEIVVTDENDNLLADIKGNEVIEKNGVKVIFKTEDGELIE